ncbi:hypothetical protein LINGRAHAP2_LOCUS20441 [Linum grandiflorum]
MNKGVDGVVPNDVGSDVEDEYDDGFNKIFEDSDLEDFDVNSIEDVDFCGKRENAEFWVADGSFIRSHKDGVVPLEAWVVESGESNVVLCIEKAVVINCTS